MQFGIGTFFMEIGCGDLLQLLGNTLHHIKQWYGGIASRIPI